MYNFSITLSLINLFYLVAGASNNGREDGPGCVISGETGLAHAGAVVDDKSSCVLVTHGGRLN
jgi:hypothetical protein